jgi:hypothetical protein
MSETQQSRHNLPSPVSCAIQTHLVLSFRACDLYAMMACFAMMAPSLICIRIFVHDLD